MAKQSPGVPVQCPKCNARVYHRNLSNHMANVHPGLTVRASRKTLLVAASGIGLLALVAVGLMSAQSQQLQTQAGAPDFQLTDTQGKSLSLASFKGKPLLLHLMAGTWCPLCIRQNRELQTTYSAVGDRVSFLNVNLDPSEDAATLEAYGQRLGIPWPQAKDTDNIWRKYPGIAIGKPGTAIYIIDSRGSIAAKLFGIQRGDQLSEALKAVT